ncbi:hypothetical protein B0H14DRAFT_2648355 [Mycena olivaceomarginata]|nr:hypothetical protein B0H14DRAFT_2648355 [Mycena olivaceomarginata]
MDTQERTMSPDSGDYEDEVVQPTPTNPLSLDVTLTSSSDAWSMAGRDTHTGLEVYTVGHLMPHDGSFMDGLAAVTLALGVAGVGAGGALGAWCSGRTQMLRRGAGSRENMVLGGRRKHVEMYDGVPLATALAMLALAGSREKTRALRFGAADARHINLHCLVVREQRHLDLRGLRVSQKRVEEERGGRLFVASIVEMSPRLGHHSEGKRQYWGISL